MSITHRLSRRGRAHAFAAAAIAVCGLAVGLLIGRPVSPAEHPSPSLNCADLAQSLLREMGVTPTTLAAVNADDVQVTAIVLGALALCESATVSYAANQAAIEQIAGRIQVLEDRVRCGQAAPAEREELTDARDQLAGLIDEREVWASQAEGIVESTLTTDQQRLLAKLHAARGIEVPLEYKADMRSEADWTALRDQLAEHNTCVRRGEAPPSTAERSSEVGLVADRVELRLAEVRGYWDNALGR